MIYRNVNIFTICLMGMNRIKCISLGHILLIVLAAIFLITSSIVFLSIYPDWIFYREHDPIKNKIVKKWIPGLSFFKDQFPKLINNNIAAVKNIIYYKEFSEKSEIPSIRLSIQKNGFEILNYQIFQYGLGFFDKKQRISGLYHTSDALSLPALISLRGVTAAHHMIWKPSLRVTLKNKKIVNGFRDRILIAPEDGVGLRNYLTTELSNRWDMLNIGEHFVRLFVNNKYMGIYSQIWRLGRRNASNGVCTWEGDCSLERKCEKIVRNSVGQIGITRSVC